MPKPLPKLQRVAAYALILRDDRILLTRLASRISADEKWHLPGGGVDHGENPRDALVREIREETGLDVEVTGLVGIYSDPKHVIAYSDGEVRQQFTLAFRTRLLGGELRSDSESHELRFVDREELDRLNIHPSMCKRIEHFLENRPAPYLG